MHSCQTKSHPGHADWLVNSVMWERALHSAVRCHPPLQLFGVEVRNVTLPVGAAVYHSLTLCICDHLGNLCHNALRRDLSPFMASGDIGIVRWMGTSADQLINLGPPLATGTRQPSCLWTALHQGWH